MLLYLLPLPCPSPCGHQSTAFINTNSCLCLGTSSTALSKVVQNACLLLVFCVSVGAYAKVNITAFARPRSSSVTFSKQSLINSCGRAARVMVLFTANTTPPCPFFPPSLPTHSRLQYSTVQYTREPARIMVECLLRRVFCSRMMHTPVDRKHSKHSALVRLRASHPLPSSERCARPL